MDNFDRQIEARWEEMVRKGVLQEVGISEEGESEYFIDKERLREVDLELYEEYILQLDEAVLFLFTRGLVDVDFREDMIAVELSDKGKEWAQAAGLTYPDF